MKNNEFRLPLLVQPEMGYRYSIDAHLLAAFSCRFGAQTWCDLGSGCGIVAFLLGRALPQSRGWAIERQKELVGFAEQNLSGMDVKLVFGDIREFPWSHHRFDLLVCNPPFYELGEGRINRDPVAAQARHCFHGNLLSFILSSSVSLEPEGVFSFILPKRIWLKQREQLTQHPWRVLASLDIQSFAGQEPNLVCVALNRDGRAHGKATKLVLYSAHRELTAEAKAFLTPLMEKMTDNGDR